MANLFSLPLANLGTATSHRANDWSEIDLTKFVQNVTVPAMLSRKERDRRANERAINLAPNEFVNAIRMGLIVG